MIDFRVDGITPDRRPYHLEGWVIWPEGSKPFPASEACYDASQRLVFDMEGHDGFTKKQTVHVIPRQWTQTPPKEGGLYWLWLGDEDSAPIPVTVMSNEWSAWVAPGQWGWNRAQDMDELANAWWKPCETPSLPHNVQGDGSPS